MFFEVHANISLMQREIDANKMAIESNDTDITNLTNRVATLEQRVGP